MNGRIQGRQWGWKAWVPCLKIWLRQEENETLQQEQKYKNGTLWLITKDLDVSRSAQKFPRETHS